jgi:hypothetical protein
MAEPGAAACERFDLRWATRFVFVFAFVGIRDLRDMGIESC